MRRKHNTQPKIHVKKDDMVKVLSGQYRGQRGRVLEVFPRKGTAIVEDINMVTKHLKPTQQNPNGERREEEAPIRIAKLQVIDPKSGDPTRVGRRPKEDGGFERYAKASGEAL